MAGEVVALPTDTVYGLAASLGSPEAIARIFAIKERPFDVALPIMVASSRQIEALGVTWPLVAQALEDAFWPGPLTIVVDCDPALATRVGGSTSAGFRAPAKLTLLNLLDVTGPLCVTSANKHGEEPCHDADDVLRVFAETTLAGVLDGGRCDGTVSSVVTLLSNGWRLARAGALDAAMLGGLLGPQVVAGD
jgi:L-threonylcarbamoyladenylate synthase